MQKIINQILEGNFDYENGSLDFSCAKIELSVQAGEQAGGSFRIFARSNGQPVNGSVMVSDWRMECLTKQFAGAEEEIFYCFHGETLEEGEVIKGCFEIVSNQGEYYLPYVATVEYRTVDSSVGEVKNLFHFANLARSSWQEALGIFYSPDFYRILSGTDARFSEDYRALSVEHGEEQGMEEFLIQTNKKQKVEYAVKENALFLTENGSDVTEYGIYIIRNGWGFTLLNIECEGEFLFTEKEVLTDDDFLGNSCRLPVFVDGSLCHEGRNYGRILLRNCYAELEISVTVQKGKGEERSCQDLEKKSGVLKLMRHYQAFRCKKIGTSQWLKETGRLVERMVAADSEDLAARLFQTQLLITESRFDEAGWILDHVSGQFEKQKVSNEILAYYYYLTTLIHSDAEYIGRMTVKVEHIYRRDGSNWRVAWLLLYLSEEFQRSERAKWNFLEEMFERGCRSPVLYIEALLLINNNPSLLRRLGRFEKQVTGYGVRQGALGREASEQFVFLVGRVKEYSEILFRTLKLLYEKKKDVQLLQEICALLIKGGKAGAEYFGWYQAGVEAQLRITKLYEYYMMSLDVNRQQEVPKAVLMYFSYQNHLDYVRSAYLYDYVLKNWNKPGDIYDAYRGRMESFVVEQIKKGHINRHLANLYNQFLQPDMVNEQTGDALSRLIFAHLIQVEDEKLKKVYVYQPGNRFPAVYPLYEGKAWVPLYGSQYTIVFEDGEKNRFCKSVEYTIEKLMISGRFLRWLADFTDENPALALYLCEGESAYREQEGREVKRQLRVAASDYADLKVKRRLYLQILTAYYDADDLRALDEYLEFVPAKELAAKERAEVVRLMVLRGKFRLAGDWMEAYGPYFIDPKILVRLIGTLMREGNMTESHVLTAAAMYVFQKGKYDGTVLEYLIMHYQGITRNMRDIWKAARSFEIDCYRLSERMLVQMLYSGAFVGEKMEIFRYYLSQGAKPEVEEAFLAQCAYDYFVKERVMEPEVFHEIRQMYLRQEPIQKVCKLAYLKYSAEEGKESCMEGGSFQEDVAMKELFLKEMLAQEIHLDFFKNFTEYGFVQLELADKTILEYRTLPGSRVCLHYSLLADEEGKEGYQAEYMREAYGGVFFKEFVLFFGETVQYYITEERDGEEQLTVSGTLQKREEGAREDGRYRLINDLAISRAVQDYDTLDDLLEEYYKKDYLGGRLFALK